MTQIKICGITNLDDARAAAEAGADMLGFVFAESPRRVEPEAARRIATEISSATYVGVFVNQPAEFVTATATQVGLHFVQLHGDEPADTAGRMPVPVIRRIAVRLGDSVANLTAQMNQFPAAAYLLDPGAGTGRTFDWTIARDIDRPIWLAGGLTPGNVAEAIRTVRPLAVDVSSGVERSPGRKDRQAMIDFVQAVRSCDVSHDA